MPWFVQYPFWVQKSGGKLLFFCSLSLCHSLFLLFLHPQAVIFLWPLAHLAICAGTLTGMCNKKALPTFFPLAAKQTICLQNHYIPWLWLDASLNLVRISSRGGALMRLTLLNNAIIYTASSLLKYIYVCTTYSIIYTEHILLCICVCMKKFPHRSVWAALVCLIIE